MGTPVVMYVKISSTFIVKSSTGI